MNDLIDAKTAAGILGIAIHTLYIKTHKRKLPFYRTGESGSRILFDRAEVEVYAQRRLCPRRVDAVTK